MSMTGFSKIGSLQCLCLLGIREYPSADPGGLPARVSYSDSRASDAVAVDLSSDSRRGAPVSSSYAVVLAKTAGLVKRVVEVDREEASGAAYSTYSDDVSSILEKYRAISSPTDSAPLVDMFI